MALQFTKCDHITKVLVFGQGQPSDRKFKFYGGPSVQGIEITTGYGGKIWLM